MMRLNVGCGLDVRAGWVNVDVTEYEPWNTLWMDMRALEGVQLHGRSEGTFLVSERSLPFVDDTFDGAVAHHVLQMVAWPDLVRWLDEVRRVLKPGAWLRITVPDLLGAMRAYDDDERAWFPIDDEHEQSIDGKLCLYLTQAGATRSLFTTSWLMELCKRAGFDIVIAPLARLGVTMSDTAWLTALDSRLDESICVEARK